MVDVALASRTGMAAEVPVVAPVTVTTWSPPGSPPGSLTATDAVPASSSVAPLAAVLSTGNVPRSRSPIDTMTSSSTGLPGALIVSDDRSNASVSPASYVVGAPDGKLTPTA